MANVVHIRAIFLITIVTEDFNWIIQASPINTIIFFDSTISPILVIRNDACI